MRYIAPVILVLALIWGCDRGKGTLYGEWIFYYAHGDSMVYQFDTAQMIIRKFAIIERDSGLADSVVPFERIFFYDKHDDTLYLDWAMPTDTGVALFPSSYHLIRKVTPDSLILAPELGPDILFKRYSDKWPEQSKAQMIYKYRNWLKRHIIPPEQRDTTVEEQES